MTTQNTALVRDNSTLANFKSWGSTISAFFTTAGWTQSGDTGQVNWSTIASVPAVNTYVYEIWEPNDGLTNFFLKVEYGTNAGSTNTAPSIRISVGTSTNGAGTLTGTVTSPITGMPNGTTAVTSTVTQWQCYFCGRAGQIQVMMWRDDSANNGENFFSVERSLNSSGSYTSTHVTSIICGASVATSQKAQQQTIVFGVGLAPAAAFANANIGLCVLSMEFEQGASGAFNSNVPFSPVFPAIGYYDNPLQGTATAQASDITDGTTYVVAAANMPYGVSHTYLASKLGPFSNVANGVANWSALLMRYD